MSFSDLFYPGNPERREKCVRLSQQIYDAMKNNFDSTNELIEIIRNKLGIRCATLTFYPDRTIKENAINLTGKIHEIQSHLDGELAKYQRKIEPHLYEKLLNERLELSEKFKIIRLGAKGFELILQTIVTVRAVYQTVNVLVTSACAVAQLWVGAIVIGVLILSVDLIVSAIVGARERAYLRQTAEDLQAIVNDFVPASQKYSKEINRLEFRLEEMDEK